MKNWSKFLTAALAAGMLASCSHDEADVKPVGPLGNEDAAYMSVEVSLPTLKGVRSATGDTGTEVGKDTENNVGSVLLVLASADKNTYLAHGLAGGLVSNGKALVTANAKIDRTDIQQLYNDAGKAKAEIVNVFVFCNPTAELISKMEDLNVDDEFVDSVCDVLQSTGDTPDQNLTVWAPNSFLMTNAKSAERSIPAKFEDWLQYTTFENPFNLSDENVDGTDNSETEGRGPIEVERAVARFDFRDGSPANTPANTYEISTLAETNDGMLKVELVNMSLVNMSKEFYYLRRVSSNGRKSGSGYKIGGLETATNYIVDTDADFKYSAKLKADEAQNDLTKLKEYFNYPLFNDAGAITNNTRTQWNTFSINEVLGYEEDNEGWDWGTNTDPKDYHIWRYVTENTIPGDEDHQKNALTTGIIFKGKMVAGDGLEDEETGHKALADAINGTYEVPTVEGKPNAYTQTVADKQYPIIYTFLDRIYVGWNDEVIKVAENEGDGSPLYVAAMTDSGNGNPNDLYQDLVAAITSNNSAAVIEAMSKFRAAAVAAGFTIYQASEDEDGGAGYYFYYYAWNRHNDNGDNGRMGPMEFGVVRNNVYKLAVTKISRLGHPRITSNDPDPKHPDDPDEDGDVYLTLSVRVLPWTVRVNNFEF